MSKDKVRKKNKDHPDVYNPTRADMGRSIYFFYCCIASVVFLIGLIKIAQ
jgi:hypothetical protein